MVRLLFFFLVSSLASATPKVLIVPTPEAGTDAMKVAGPFPDQKFSFYERGRLVATLTVEEMAQRVVPLELTVLDPYSLSDEIYRGLPLESLFYAVYKEKWRRADNEVIFTFTNGTKAALPGAKIIKYASYLTYERRGSPTFAVLDERGGGKVVDVGPFYLVWDNFREPNLKDLGSKDWHRNIVSIDLLDFLDRYPQMIPPKNSSAAVKEGFAAFRKYCVLCHTINGDGGVRGTDLNYPVNVTEYLSDTWLRRWITNPQGIRFNTTMPALDKRDPNAANNATNIIAYLKAMKRHKQKPRNAIPQ